MQKLFLTLFCLSSLVAAADRSSDLPAAACVKECDFCCDCYDDDYLTGYVQALIDVHYYEYDVGVIVEGGVAYLYNLPNNDLIARSIVCFVKDVPHICGVDCESYECQCPPPPCRIHGIWFPQNTVLFQPLIADPRQVMNAAELRFNDNVIGKHVGAPSFGGDFILLRLKDIFCWRGDMDLGVQAGIFAVFDLDHPEACLVNTDFFVAAMVTYAYQAWSYRFRFWHLSSHLGDEFLLANPSFDRRNLSDEGVDFFASYQMGHAVRLYAGIGYITDRDDEFPEQPLYFEGGTEIRVFGVRDCFNRIWVQPFLAMHFRAWEEHDFDIDQTYALGVEWSRLAGVGRKFRVYFVFHDGYSKEGQFVRQRSNYFGTKISYSF